MAEERGGGGERGVTPVPPFQGWSNEGFQM